MYLTEEQAKKILDNEIVDLILLSDSNPNFPACRTMKDVIDRGNGNYYSAAIGFFVRTGSRQAHGTRAQKRPES